MNELEMKKLADLIAAAINHMPGPYYNIATLAFSVPAKIDFDTRTNGYTVKNAGNQILIFDDEILQPGESKAVGGNKGEIFIGRKELTFQTPAGFVGTAVPLAYVTIKYYTGVDPNEPGYPKFI